MYLCRTGALNYSYRSVSNNSSVSIGAMGRGPAPQGSLHSHVLEPTSDELLRCRACHKIMKPSGAYSHVPACPKDVVRLLPEVFRLRYQSENPRPSTDQTADQADQEEQPEGMPLLFRL